jgi:hypothetical protein
MTGFPWQMENFFHFHGNSMSQCWLLDGKNISLFSSPFSKNCAKVGIFSMRFQYHLAF